MKNELDLFKEIWERESEKTLKLLQSLPELEGFGTFNFFDGPGVGRSAVEHLRADAGDEAAAEGGHGAKLTRFSARRSSPRRSALMSSRSQP